MPALGLVLIGVGALYVWAAIANESVPEQIRAVLTGGSPGKIPDTGNVSPIAVDYTVSPDSGGNVGAAAGGAIPGGPSTAGKDPAGHSVPDLQAYAKQLLAQRGWSAQWTQFNALVMGESGWSWDISNPGHHGYNGENHAYGIPQALPPGKMASAGADWKTNGYTQLRWMMAYIASSYGNPANAYAKWLSRSPHWY
jgi:hypothetical protein